MSLREEVDMATWTRICCPIDFSETSRVAMEEAAERRGAKVARSLVVSGAAATEVVRVVREGGYDLVVMGTHGRRGIRHLVLGSVAERVVREAPCAVLVVRPRSR